jgi:hyperosmotically inducible protein
MKTKVLITCITLAVLAAPIAGYTEDSDANRTQPKVYAKDTVITTKIKAKLAKESIASTLKISVDTVNNGDVSLTGTAKTQAAADEAVSIARKTEGVKNVHSDIKIKAED